jgi:putative FmdB family regulatory protein
MMPTYEHICKKCSHEWEDTYGMKDPVPDVCPNCKETGCVQRLISAVSGRVEIQGRHETHQWLKKEARDAVKKANTDENYRANAYGEDRYHQDAVDRKVLDETLRNL